MEQRYSITLIVIFGSLYEENLGRTLPSTKYSNQSDGSSAQECGVSKNVDKAPSSSIEKVVTRLDAAADNLSEVSIQSAFVQAEKARSIVVAGLPEADFSHGLEVISSFEWSNIWALLSDLGVRCEPAFAHRLGKVKKNFFVS
ncbi:hypothetical protein GCK32_005013 [Trichostrongylus colubriformis]|uniref:Uncharacterized protein n=1 Tax=Trichostrongylus colubriformis TaxID=6319 RepID=A0AAN8IQT4_TRICO